MPSAFPARPCSRVNCLSTVRNHFVNSGWGGGDGWLHAGHDTASTLSYIYNICALPLPQSLKGRSHSLRDMDLAQPDINSIALGHQGRTIVINFRPFFLPFQSHNFFTSQQEQNQMFHICSHRPAICMRIATGVSMSAVQAMGWSHHCSPVPDVRLCTKAQPLALTYHLLWGLEICWLLQQ